MKGLRAATLLGAMAALAASALMAADVFTYSIQACSPDVAERSGCEAADPELARWAMDAWQQAAGPGLRFVEAQEQNGGRIRIFWLGKRAQLYGDARVMYVDGKRGASIEVHPDLTQFGPEIAGAGRTDHLFRDTVVYLTCLHEIGHGVGLEHTADFADIMYSFQYGGDVLEYFGRYRRELQDRSDIRMHTGISKADRTHVAILYAGR